MSLLRVFCIITFISDVSSYKYSVLQQFSHPYHKQKISYVGSELSSPALNDECDPKLIHQWRLFVKMPFSNLARLNLAEYISSHGWQLGEAFPPDSLTVWAPACIYAHHRLQIAPHRYLKK